MAGSGDTDDDALTPAFVASFEGSSHDVDIASAVKGVVATTISHLGELLNDGLVLEVIGVDEVSGTKLLGPLLLGGVDINDNDLAGLVDDGTLDNRETDAAGTEDGNAGSLLDVGGHTSSTVTGGDTAAE